MLYEDDVVSAVADYLADSGWTILSTALATQTGNDIVAECNGRQIVVEAKGEGSSKAHSARYGMTFNRNQVGTHVGVAVLRAMLEVSAEVAIAAVAFPSTLDHRREVARVAPALSSLGIWVFWVLPDQSVEIQR